MVVQSPIRNMKSTNHFNIVSLFFAAAEKYPNNVAIIEKDQQVSFAEFKQQVEDTAHYFLSKGIQKGDRVLIFVPMSIDLYRIVLALFSIGATAVFLDEWVSRERMERCCEIAQCKAFIGGLKIRLLAYFSSALRQIPIKLGLSYKRKHTVRSSTLNTTTTDTALITFTTGSTGTPKAAKRTHGFLHEQFKALIDKIDPQATDVDMPILPIVLLINLGVGCTSVIAEFNARKPTSLNEQKIIDQIKTHQVNRLVASPFLIKRLAAFMLDKKIELPTVEKIFTGGAPVFPTEAKSYAQAFPDANVEIVYGSTEAEPISAINVNALISDHQKEQGLNVGVPYHGTAVKIIEVTDHPFICESEVRLKQLELAQGQIGEIIVSGNHVLREYINNEEALKRNKIFIGDQCWHRTGDSGYLDAAGNLFLTGRCNTLIPVQEGYLAPFIFENYFQTLEGVEMGTILKYKDHIIAVIELNDRSKKSMISRKIMEKENRIEVIQFIDQMPRDPRHHSKIDYAKLKMEL